MFCNFLSINDCFYWSAVAILVLVDSVLQCWDYAHLDDFYSVAILVLVDSVLQSEDNILIYEE